MKDIIYAGFAQFSYLNWHKLNDNYKGFKLKTLLKSGSSTFNQIKTPDYNNMQTDGKDYYMKKENNKKIYSGNILYPIEWTINKKSFYRVF